MTRDLHANERLMKRLCPALAGALMLAACSSDAINIRGSLAEAAMPAEQAAGLSVMEADSADNQRALNGREFELATRDSGSIALVFNRGTREMGRMRLVGVPRGARLTLHDVWFDYRKRAFPARVALEGVEVLEVNGIRMAPSERVPTSLDEPATVLALSTEALFARPADPGRPDLRVLLDSATQVETTGGEPGSLTRLGFGDSVRIEGRRVGEYVRARRLVIPADEDEIPSVPSNNASVRPGIREEDTRDRGESGRGEKERKKKQKERKDKAKEQKGKGDKKRGKG